jgi:aminoglycoside phosphotransferase (APT) family kinase protein
MVSNADPARIAGILDGEISTLGDPLADLGFLIAHWDVEGAEPHPIAKGTTAAPGFATHDKLLAQYAERTGLDVTTVPWYVAFADLKLAVLLEGIHARHLAGHTHGTDSDEVGAMVDDLLARARKHAAAIPTTTSRGSRA